MDARLQKRGKHQNTIFFSQKRVEVTKKQNSRLNVQILRQIGKVIV